MKKEIMGLVHFVFLIVVVLSLVVTLSSCNMTENVALNGKNLITDKLKDFKLPLVVSLKSDTSLAEMVKDDKSSNKEITSDYRYDNMFK